MDRVGEYFSFRGRSTRLSFWRVQLLMLVIFAVLLGGAMGLAIALGDVAAQIAPLALLPVVVAFGWLYAANGVRRLHDRGKPALWLVLFWGAPSLLSEAAKAIEKDQRLALVGLILAFVSLGLSIWGFVEMGFLAGQPGPNRFGDNPQMPTAEVFA